MHRGGAYGSITLSSGGARNGLVAHKTGKAAGPFWDRTREFSVYLDKARARRRATTAATVRGTLSTAQAAQCARQRKSAFHVQSSQVVRDLATTAHKLEELTQRT